VGDVVLRDGDIHGDGVNIAARIEPLAAAGGICISSAVQEQVRNKVSQPMAALGPAELKNIELPVVVHRVLMPWDTPENNRCGPADAERGPRDVGRGTTGRPRLPPAVTKLAWGGALLVAVALAVAAWFRAQPHTTSDSRPAETNAAAKAPAGPVRIERLVVLPLRNYSGDTNQDYFVDGMTDILNGELAQIEGLQVKSHTTSMRYKGTTKSLAEIGRELNIEGVVEVCLVHVKPIARS
jgi:hypothetical protein